MNLSSKIHHDRRPTFSLASGLRIICARCAIAPASTTVCASSGECLQMSLRAEAAIRFSEISGSCDQLVCINMSQQEHTDCLRLSKANLNAEHEERYCASIHHTLSELSVVSCNVAKRPRCRFLHSWIKLFQADNKRIECAAVHHRLCKLWGVLCHRTQDECSCFFVESLKCMIGQTLAS